MNPLVLPLNIGKDDTFRITWNGRYFQAKGALVLPRKVTTTFDAAEMIESTQLVLKLTEFRSALRTKILATLSDSENGLASQTEVFGLVVQVNVRSGKINAIEDVRKAVGANPTENVDFLSEAAQVLNLSDAERKELEKSINASFTPTVLEALRQPFIAFAPELSTLWKDQDLKSIQADKLVPFQMLFPNGQPIERFVDGERYVIDDLYCTNPSCNCTDVTCVVLKLLPASGTEVAWGGFKWNIETDKFRPLPQFSNKFNASEWFKQFNAGSAFDLKLLLTSRQKFMRSEYIAARKAAGKS
ncbi:MAG: hypothetical protein ACO3A4_07825 [Silvanigrellaceae bacterium]